ncbi:MAG TPA: beta-galactosidase trimerization domain-containing protein, partial [Candidatus Brocadiia bacterium]|nr:beta-galactosidase trimerization domain-containing protein [Candidatus Brocadiia bacterium]
KKTRQHRFRTPYRIYFSAQGAAPPPPPAPAGKVVPERGEIFPNGGFEEMTAEGAPKDHVQFRAGLMALDTAVFHDGRQSLRLNPPRDSKSSATTAGFGVADMRVESGQNYIMGFWARAQGTDAAVSCSSSLQWRDRNGAVLKDAQGQVLRTTLIASRYYQTDFDWTYAEKTVEAPKDAFFADLYLSTWSKVGNVWLDGITARPQVLPSDPIEAARMKIETTTWPDVGLMLDVSPEVVTPHTPWMKPAAGGPVKTLYLAQMSKDTDGVARNVIELAQRLQMDWAFLPVLKRRLPTYAFYVIKTADDIEPFTVELLKSRLREHWDLIVADHVDFNGVQKEFTDLLLGAADAGAGVLFLDCRNLPATIAVKGAPPASFAIMPHLNPRVPATACGGLAMAQRRKGRMAVMSSVEKLYPCIPHGQTTYMIDLQAKALPGWEYRFIPLIKAALWLAGRQPAASVTKAEAVGGALRFAISGRPAQGYALEITLRDTFGRASEPRKLPLEAGASVLEARLPKLLAGQHAAEFRLLDADGNIVDFGATAFTVASACVIQKLSTDKRVYHGAESVSVLAEVSQAPQGASLVVELYDAYDRVVARRAAPLASDQTSARVTLPLSRPLTILHRAFARVVKGGDALCEGMVEFSAPDGFPQDDEYSIYLWNGGPQFAPGYLMALKQAGFENVLLEPGRMEYAGDPVLRAGLRAWGYSLRLGSLRDDGSGPPGVRVPCFNDPAWWKKVEASVQKFGPGMAYYGLRDFILDDEVHLGAETCFCPHCMARFHEYLKASYPGLAALNRAWGTQLKNWGEARPLTLKETWDKSAPLASWLDHKMFMALTFAQMIGRVRDLCRPFIPDIKVGLSGTQNPDYTYNWAEFLKYAECIGNYGGVQCDLIQSFKKPGSRVGRWTGGYAYSWVNAEKYERCAPWEGIFSGSPCYFFFHGTSCWGMRGDLRMNTNTRMALEEARVIQEGIDKLLLSTPRRDDGVAVHYSHASCFAAAGRKDPRSWSAAVDGWRFLLDDLGLGFRFVSTEQVEQGLLRGGKVKVFILPVSYCLSAKEVDALARFVEDGGTVIADHSPGVYDGHGGAQDKDVLTKLFGVRRAAESVKDLEGMLEITDSPLTGGKARAIRIRYADEGLTLAQGKALARFAGKPALVVHEIGKGRAVLLGCVMRDYAKSDLVGGGETQLIGRGDPALTTPLREMVASILDSAGVRPAVTLTTGDGVNFQPLTKTAVYDAGAIRYAGLLKPDSAFKPIQPHERVPVKVDMGTEGHIYDVRAGKYLGKGRRADIVMTPAIGQVLAVLPYRVDRVEVTAGDVERGETVTAQVNIKAQGDMGRHVVMARFVAPDGKETPYYRTKAVLEKGSGSITISTALNDAPGAWTVHATDVASGITGKATFTLK